MPNFLDLIKGEGVAVQVIRSLVDQPLSSNAILSKLSEQGIGIRRTTGLQVINYLRDTVSPAKKYIDFLTLNSLPNVTRLPLSVTKQLRNFSYKVAVTGFNTTNGELATSFINISSNELLTKQQAIDVAVDLAANSGRGYGVNGGSGKVIDVSQNNAGIIIP